MPKDEKKKNGQKENNYIKFIAALPAIQTAITLDGMGDGGMVKFAVPRSHVNALLDLQKLAGQNLGVIIIPLGKDDKITDEFDLQDIKLDL